MALIKCPECGNKVSDQAANCPKCGYELREDTKEKKINIPKGSFDYKYLIVIVVLVVGAFLIFGNNNSSNNNNQNNNQDNNQNNNQNQGGNQTNSGTLVYSNSKLGIYFEYPSNYKTYVGSDNAVYIGQSIDEQGALIPYIVVERYSNYNDCVSFLSDFTTALKKEYGNVAITIDLVANNIGSNYFYGMQYMYNSNGHVVVDNRYATNIGGKVFMVASREENTNTEEINNVVRVIASTLKEVR